VNTNNTEDLEYLEGLLAAHPDYYRKHEVVAPDCEQCEYNSHYSKEASTATAV
jgi:hypothetical protein